MKCAIDLDKVLFPTSFALVALVPQFILIPLCLVKTTSLVCRYFEQFALVPMRVVENYEIYRLFTTPFMSGTPWQALLNAFVMYAVIETAQTRLYLWQILLQCLIVSTISSLVQLAFGCCFINSSNIYFAQEYYRPQYGFGPVVIFFATQNLRSGKVILCMRVPAIVLSIAVLLIMQCVQYPITCGWVWNLTGFVLGWLWRMHRDSTVSGPEPAVGQ